MREGKEHSGMNWKRENSMGMKQCTTGNEHWEEKEQAACNMTQNVKKEMEKEKGHIEETSSFSIIEFIYFTISLVHFLVLVRTRRKCNGN